MPCSPCHLILTFNSSQILASIDPTLSLEVRHLGGALAFIADPARIRELCSKGQVCGSARGKHIRYLELIVPLTEVSKDFTPPQRSHSGCVGEDSRTVRRGEDLLANVYSHDNGRCGAYGGSREAYFALGS